jgi:hypothetical protein
VEGVEIGEGGGGVLRGRTCLGKCSTDVVERPLDDLPLIRRLRDSNPVTLFDDMPVR